MRELLLHACYNYCLIGNLMPTLKIQFCDTEKKLAPFELEWEILDNPAARAWTKLLIIYLKADFESSFRFVGFIHSKRNYSFLSQEQY